MLLMVVIGKCPYFRFNINATSSSVIIDADEKIVDLLAKLYSLISIY